MSTNVSIINGQTDRLASPYTQGVILTTATYIQSRVHNS
jgi:hypothetical protein